MLVIDTARPVKEEFFDLLVCPCEQVDVAITADIGTLQRLPGIVGDGVARELCLTARVFGAEEAKRIGLVSGTPFLFP